MGPRFSLTRAERERGRPGPPRASLSGPSRLPAPDADAQHALVGGEVDPPAAGRAEQRGHQLVVRQHQQVARPAQLGHLPAGFLAAAAFRLENDPQIALAIVADLFEEGREPGGMEEAKGVRVLFPPARAAAVSRQSTAKNPARRPVFMARKWSLPPGEGRGEGGLD